MSKKRKIVAVGSLVILGGLVVAAFSPAGKAIRTLLPTFMQKDVSGTEAFRGDLEDRLRAMYTAADLYQTSEQAYPDADKWMDELLTRLKTQNLKPGEAEKKMKRPDLESNSGQYGFAMNKAMAGKYLGDLKDRDSILIYESKETTKNASGDPKTDAKPGGDGITISGKIVKL